MYMYNILLNSAQKKDNCTQALKLDNSLNDVLVVMLEILNSLELHVW